MQIASPKSLNDTLRNHIAANAQTSTRSIPPWLALAT